MSVKRKESLKLLFLVLLLVTSYVSISITSHAAEGGTHGGGGGTINEELVDINFLSTEISQMKPFVEMAINYLDFLNYAMKVNPVPSPAARAAQQLKPHLSSMKSKVKSEGFFVLQHRACKDQMGRDVDASVADPEYLDKVCISSKTLSTKLTYNNYFSGVVSLLMHEEAHLFGASEDQARAIQQVINMFLKSGDRLGALLHRFINENDELINDVKKLIASVETKNQPQICMELSTLSTKYGRLIPVATSPLMGGMSVLDGAGHRHYSLGVLQANFTNSYCFDESSVEWKNIAKLTMGKDVIAASKVVEKIFEEGDQIIVVKPGDRSQLKNALVIIEQYLMIQKYQAESISPIDIPKGDLVDQK